MAALIHDDSKPFTDRDRYRMNRDQLLHNYERAVENAQYLVVEISETRRKYQELEKRLDGLEDSHTNALVRVAEEEAKLVEFIKTRRHFRDDDA